METETIPLCINLSKYRKRRQYRRLNGVIVADIKENLKISTCHKIHQSFRKMLLIPKKFRDSYEEMMLRFARHVALLNNDNLYLLMKRNHEVQQLALWKGLIRFQYIVRKKIIHVLSFNSGWMQILFESNDLCLSFSSLVMVHSSPPWINHNRWLNCKSLLSRICLRLSHSQRE